MSNSTSMPWPILLKGPLANACWALGSGVLINKTTEFEALNRIMKTSQSTKIIRIHITHATAS
ncbi:hypothetical protein HanRHA438_Chr03g0104811 [Helianthus annuus]|nr:hypothetical protein HanRHA438_Chr03g0104811 [Helianthus annuus]